MFKAASGAVYRGVKAQAGSPRSILTGQLVSAGAIADYVAVNAVGTLNASAVTNLPQFSAPSLTASGGAQPIILPFGGQKYLANFGVAGNFVSTPATVGNTITGDVSAVVTIAPNSVSAAVNDGFVSQFNNAGQRNFEFYRRTDGKLGFLYSTDGTASVSKPSTVTLASVGLVAGQQFDVGVYQDVDNGASGNTVTFYYSTDNRVTWNQLGAPVVTAGAITRHGSTDPIAAWAIDNLIQGINGKGFGASIYSGNYFARTGVIASDFNASDWPETTTNGATAVSSTTGETWTLANTGTLLAQIVGSPQLVFDGAAYYMQMTATIPAPYFAIEVANYITWTSTDVMADGKTSNSFAAQQITGTPQVKMYDGTSLTASVSPVLNTYNIISAGQDGSGNATIQLNAGTAATGTLNHTALAGWTEGANGAATKFGNKQLKERILFPVTPSAGQLANINALLKAIHGTP